MRLKIAPPGLKIPNDLSYIFAICIVILTVLEGMQFSQLSITVNPRANRCNIVGSLLANNSQHCWMLHVTSVCTHCCMLLDVVAQSLKPVKLFSQQFPTVLLFRDWRRSVAQKCWTCLHSSSNIVGATHAHYL